MGKKQMLLSILLYFFNMAHCLEHDNRSMEFSLACSKNLTGHWVTQFKLDNAAPNLPKNWKVNVKHSITSYGGVESFHLVGNVIVPPPKPADYELYPGIGYYKFHHADKATFDEASMTCFREGGHLMIINSNAEAKVVEIFFARHKGAGPYAFLGFHDRIKEGEFITIFGQPFIETGYKNWLSTDPNNYGGNENCGCVTAEGKLGDIGCDAKLSYFCEYDLSWSDL